MGRAWRQRRSLLPRTLTALSALLALNAPTSFAQSVPSGIIHDPFPVRLVFTGDINLGTRTLPDGLPPDSGRTLLGRVDSLLKGDLVVGNFEGVLSDSGSSLKCGPPPDSAASDSAPRRKRLKQQPRRSFTRNCYAFATPGWLAPRLSEAGFTHLNLANNHANDYGIDARVATEAELRALGMTPYGPLEDVAITPVLRDGKMTLVGLIGFTTYPHAYNLLDLSHSAAIVDSVRSMVDLLIVTFHGGTEGKAAVRTWKGPEYLGREPRGDLRKFARVVIDAGADAVVGHGPHVLRGIEFYRGKPVFYSLGNFLTYRGFNLDGPLGITALLSLELSSHGEFESARMTPLLQLPGAGPGPDSTAQAVSLLRRVTALDFPETGARIADDGGITPP